MEWLWSVLFVAVLGVLWWLAHQMEPHYSSKDGTRFMANAQEIIDGKPLGRMRETRVNVQPDGLLYCSQKKVMKRNGADFVLVGASTTPPRKLKVYLAHAVQDGMSSSATELAIRIPEKSRVVPLLDGILAERALRQRQSPGTS